MAGEIVPYRTDYEAVAPNATDQILGPNGAVGDVLERLVVSVITAATSSASIKDGNGSTIVIAPANTPIGVYSVPIGARAVNATTPGWKVTTGAGVRVLAVGRFT
jgi:hypothetical protein